MFLPIERMFLHKLEMVGFKSFADKAEIDFLPPSDDSKGITAIVGPNGSGKSNVADAIRWVLGEQSTKLLRGKKAEDVIFSGSEKRTRSGFAETTLHLNNEDGQLPLDLSEVTISRRIYRDGDSEYLLNKNKVRLTDIQLLLAQAQFGARTYSVIGQGMVDSILVASPQERKEFFDEAAGVKQFQIKRHQSVIKMKTSKENLGQAEMLTGEIAPRLRSLSRQVKRLSERENLEEELHALKHQHYGRQWHDLKKQIDARQAAFDKLEKEWKEKEATLSDSQEELSGLEQEETSSEGFTGLQKRYEALIDERSGLRDKELKIRSEMDVAIQVQQKTSATLPLSQIIKEVSGIGDGQDSAIGALKKADTLEKARETVPKFEMLRDDTRSLTERLERPASAKVEIEPDPKLKAELEKVRVAITGINGKIAEVQQEIKSYNDSEQTKKARFFSLQRKLQERVGKAHDLERRLNEERIEIARLDTRREALEQEMTTELGENADRIKQNFTPDPGGDPENYAPRIQKLKYQLELIGGIDPEAVKEYEETKERYEFLDGQIADLNKAIVDLERVIAELDTSIKARSESAFRQLNNNFDRYFKLLFGGGKAELIQLKAQQAVAEDAEGEDDGEEETPAETIVSKDRIVGVDIHANPPGKRISSITMLSGGERALVSIALICAIMTTNPSPFVVLDEVDAALDESNADKFATIISDLARRTQFILITHNRYTMKRSNVLYGVTMSEDGTSQMLSVNLDEAGRMRGKSKKPAKTKAAAAA